MSQMAVLKQALLQNTLISSNNNPKLILSTSGFFSTLKLIPSMEHLVFKSLKNLLPSYESINIFSYSCNLINTLAKYNLESDAHSHKWGRLSVTSNQSLHLFNCSTKDKTCHSDPHVL